MCISVEPFNGCAIIWPDSDGGDCVCDCATILRCNCINSTGYNVSVVESQEPRRLLICWRNLTEDENQTLVFVVEETRYYLEDNMLSNPTATRRYISASLVIIAGMLLQEQWLL